MDMNDLEFGNIVGKGSFAVVYRGLWQGRDVALKQIRLPCASSTTVPKEVTILRLELLRGNECMYISFRLLSGN